MWLITGPFDSEQPGDEIPNKTKLLKSNRTYGVGRHKESPLTINNKKVSRQNGEFIVGEHSVDDVSNPAFVPTLSLRNTKSAALKVSRGDNVFIVNPESTYELESGDVVRLAGSLHVTVAWDPKICFYTPGDAIPKFDLTACAAIGVKLVTKHTRDVTYHITTNITAPLPPSIFLSLLNPACLVNPQWLVELVHRGNDPDGLEKNYDPPLEDSFHPLIDPTLAKTHPNMMRMSSWKPNADRKTLFDGVRIIFAVICSGIGSPTKAMADIVTRGGADRQLIDVEREAEEQAKGASSAWPAVLKKRKTMLKAGMRSGLVLVGDGEAMTAKGVPRDIKKAWESMVEKARSVQMRIIHPSLIAETIFKVDVSLIDCVIEGDIEMDDDPANPKLLPDFIPSTLPEEASQLSGMEAGQSGPDDTIQPRPPQAPVPSRMLTRRAASQTPAPEPTPPVVPMETQDESQSAPKRLLRRRAKTGGLVNQLLGLDDTAVMEESQLSREPPVQPDVVPPTPARTGRLKRRAGTAVASQLIPELQPSPEGKDEPILKKFKGLFEESGQGNVTSQIDDERPLAGGSGGVADTQLAVVVEEEEEESQDQNNARKRKADAMEEEEEEEVAMETAGDVAMRDAKGISTSKKRAIEAVNAVERSQDSRSRGVKDRGLQPTVMKGSAKDIKKGAVPGKPDTDPSFLRAIASNKRGKKLEDNFDREFNQLRIAKPVAEKAGANVSNTVQLGREWDGLDDFEKDAGIRGNFMEIVELKVWREVQGQPGTSVRRESGLGARLDWDGRADFKKFRRKLYNGEREIVKLVLSQFDDGSEAPHFNYGGTKKNRGFDDMSQSQSQSQSNSHPIFTQTPAGPRSRPKSQPKPRGRPKVIHEAVDEDDEEVEVEIGGLETRSKGKSRTSGRGKASQLGKRPPLFDLDSEEDVLPEPDDETPADDSSLTFRSSREDTKPNSRGTKRKIVLEEEDSDSDQGLTFGGFSKKARKK